MPRAKEFDPDEVLEQAMELFWEQGFEATSAQDLVDCTGLNRSSLYNTFGSKQELYLAALDRYRRQDPDSFAQLLEREDTARDAVQRILEDAIPKGSENTRGCFVANATVERAHCDEQTHQRVCETLSQMQKGFRTVLEHGQANGEIPGKKDAQALARFLSNTYFGLQTMAKLELPRETFEDIVEVALRALE